MKQYDNKYIPEQSQVKTNCWCQSIFQNKQIEVIKYKSTKLKSQSQKYIKLSPKQAKKHSIQKKQRLNTLTDRRTISSQITSSTHRIQIPSNAYQFQENNINLKDDILNKLKRRKPVKIIQNIKMPSFQSTLQYSKTTPQHQKANKDFKIQNIKLTTSQQFIAKVKKNQVLDQVSQIYENSYHQIHNLSKSVCSDLSRMTELITDIQLINNSTQLLNNARYLLTNREINSRKVIGN